MSLEYRERVRRTPALFDALSEEEKHNMLDFCGISDDIIKEQFGEGADVDKVVVGLSDRDFASLHNKVMARFRNRKKKKNQEAEATDENADEEEVEEAEILEEEAA